MVLKLNQKQNDIKALLINKARKALNQIVCTVFHLILFQILLARGQFANRESSLIECFSSHIAKIKSTLPVFNQTKKLFHIIYSKI